MLGHFSDQPLRFQRARRLRVHRVRVLLLDPSLALRPPLLLDLAMPFMRLASDQVERPVLGLEVHHVALVARVQLGQRLLDLVGGVAPSRFGQSSTSTNMLPLRDLRRRHGLLQGRDRDLALGLEPFFLLREEQIAFFEGHDLRRPRLRLRDFFAGALLRELEVLDAVREELHVRLGADALVLRVAHDARRRGRGPDVPRGRAVARLRLL
mmetsp:Transcript_22392/g.63045  ORF Transcript_22392/g.63045 Transcript_22392/m.63045 type:complete len:210 (+) Transcript_22392:96-725(+)